MHVKRLVCYVSTNYVAHHRFDHAAGIVYVYKARFKAVKRPSCIQNGLIILRRIE